MVCMLHTLKKTCCERFSMQLLVALHGVPLFAIQVAQNWLI